MKTGTAKIALLAVTLVVTPAVIYSIYDIFRVLAEAHQASGTIALHSGTHYLLLGSLLWIFVAMQQLALKGHESAVKKWGGEVLIGWFIGCLLLANIIPAALSSHLKGVGYHKCAVINAPGNRSRGQEYLYSQRPCSELNE